MSKSQLILDQVNTLGERMDSLEELIKTLIKKVDKLSTRKLTIPKKKKDLVKKVSVKKSPSKKVVKFGNVTITRYDDIVLVTGDTYARKAVLKKYMARWKPDKKGWTLNLSHYKDLKEDLQTYCENVEVEEKSEKLMEPSTTNSNFDNSSKNYVPVNSFCEIMSSDDDD